MPKIDLHVHTIATSYDTKKNRDVDFATFIMNMKNANVKYVGITNHNTFNIEQFNEFSSDQEIFVFPGIELDLLLKDDKDYKNINLIFSPNYKNNLHNVVNSWGNDRYKINGLDELLSTFDKFNPIYFCDHKSVEKRRVPDKVVRELMTKTENPVLADCKKIRTNLVLGFNNIYAMTATDNEDWLNYEEYAKILGNINWDIKSFEELHKLLKFDNSITKILLERKESKIYNIEIQKDPAQIKIVSGLNILFGGKGTGKTKIIEGIKNHIEKVDNLKTSHYKASEKNDKFKAKFPSEFALNAEDIEDFKFINKELNFVKSYEEDDKNMITDLTKFNEAAKNISSMKYKILTNKRDNNTEPSDCNVLVSFLKEYNKLIEFINKNENEMTEIKVEVSNLKSVFVNMKAKIFEKYINIFSSYWFGKFLNNLTESISRILVSQTGTKIYPTKLGLFDIWNKRKDLKNSCNKILEYKNIEEKHFEKGVSTTIPGKDEIQYIKTIKPFNVNDPACWNKLSEPTSGKMKSILKSMETIKMSVNTPSSKEIEDLLKTLSDVELTERSFISIIGAVHKVNIKDGKKTVGEAINLSDGEKSILLLMKELENPETYILLDEPSTYLGSELVKSSLLPRIIELKNEGCTIIIATHDSNLAINSLPVNMIYRKYNNNTYTTDYGNWWEKKFTNGESFNVIVTDNFEGGMESFEFRGGIYNDDFEN